MSNQEKITVLGKTFNSDEERREYFREELRKKLPELKQMEGFPIGEDENILKLSDPPYYTACPNPWLNDFIDVWEKEKRTLVAEGKRIEDFIVDEPYSFDVLEGKSHPVYMYHSYHTKVPHQVMMRYFSHYTQPGDIVFDGFSGSGMTSLAAGFMSSPLPEDKLNIENEFRKNSKNVSWGSRYCISSDLSSAASFLSSNYGKPFIKTDKGLTFLNAIEFVAEKYSNLFKTIVFNDSCSSKLSSLFNNSLVSKINTSSSLIELCSVFSKESIEELAEECNLKINRDLYYCDAKFFVWSDIYLCPNCDSEVVFFDNALNENKTNTLNVITCPSCSVEFAKSTGNKIFETSYDNISSQTKKKAKRELIKVSYHNKLIGRSFKEADEVDKLFEKRIQELPIENWIPETRLEDGYNTKQSIISHGYSSVYDFYSRRNLIVLSEFWNHLDSSDWFLITSGLTRNLMNTNRFVYDRGYWKIGRPLSGTLYVPSESVEQNPFDFYKSKIPKVEWKIERQINQISSSTNLQTIGSDSVDYIFVDPPFGSNIMYSDLNIIMESWFGVLTNVKKEAIQNPYQSKGILEYNYLMIACFKEFFRLLKPGKWMTVEFSNTSAAVWNGIQLSIQAGGFVIASVMALDKKHGTIKAKGTSTAVKQDLIISCYKPSSRFDEKFKQHHSQDVGVWDFVEEHLLHLPIHLQKNNVTTGVIERSPKILFDRLIAFYVQKNLPVPMDAGAFQLGLKNRFIERDGMFFTLEQVQEYDLKKAETPEFIQLSILVSSEQDGVMWLKNLLLDKSLNYQDIQPQWMQALAGVRKGDVVPELADILEENFLKDDKGKWYAPDPENEADLERLRNKRLLRQFDIYKSEAMKPKTKKIKEVRVESLRAGFKQCYQDKDFQTIVAVADKIPNNLLMEDEVLLQFYDIASTRI